MNFLKIIISLWQGRRAYFSAVFLSVIFIAFADLLSRAYIPGFSGVPRMVFDTWGWLWLTAWLLWLIREYRKRGIFTLSNLLKGGPEFNAFLIILSTTAFVVFIFSWAFFFLP